MTGTKEDLTAALDWALSGTTFDVGRIVTEYPEGRMTSYDDRPGETLDAPGLCQMYERARRGNEPLSRGGTPIVRLDTASRTALMDALRNLLGDYALIRLIATVLLDPVFRSRLRKFHRLRPRTHISGGASFSQNSQNPSELTLVDVVLNRRPGIQRIVERARVGEMKLVSHDHVQSASGQVTILVQPRGQSLLSFHLLLSDSGYRRFLSPRLGYANVPASPLQNRAHRARFGLPSSSLSSAPAGSGGRNRRALVAWRSRLHLLASLNLRSTAHSGSVIISNSVGFNVLRTSGTYCPHHGLGVPHSRPNAHSRRP